MSALAVLALLCVNLHPLHSRITGDEGVWPESWRRQFGWPRVAYQEFGYDARTAMAFWVVEGLLYNGMVMAGAAVAAFGAALALFSLGEPRSPSVIRDS